MSNLITVQLVMPEKKPEVVEAPKRRLTKRHLTNVSVFGYDPKGGIKSYLVDWHRDGVNYYNIMFAKELAALLLEEDED